MQENIRYVLPTTPFFIGAGPMGVGRYNQLPAKVSVRSLCRRQIPRIVTGTDDKYCDLITSYHMTCHWYVCMLYGPMEIET